MSFRLSAKNFSLTWPQVSGEWTKKMVLEHLKTKGELTRYVVARELHQDGGIHYHAYAKYAKKVDTTNPRYFDLDGCHGNYQATKNATKWAAYCMKHGDFIEDFLAQTWRGFAREHADFQAWIQHKQDSKLAEVDWPINIFGATQNRPGASDKKCNYLVIGGPDSGKTRWVEDTFHGQRIFKVVDQRYPFEGLDGESVLIWDDSFPKRKDLIAASNWYRTRTLVGETRYRRTYWKMEQRRVLILLHNEEPIYGQDEWFKARFTTLIIDVAEE